MVVLNGEDLSFNIYCHECGKYIETKKYITDLKPFQKISGARYCSSECKAFHTDKEWFVNNEYKKLVLDNTVAIKKTIGGKK